MDIVGKEVPDGRNARDLAGLDSIVKVGHCLPGGNEQHLFRSSRSCRIHFVDHALPDRAETVQACPPSLQVTVEEVEPVPGLIEIGLDAGVGGMGKSKEFEGVTRGVVPLDIRFQRNGFREDECVIFAGGEGLVGIHTLRMDTIVVIPTHTQRCAGNDLEIRFPLIPHAVHHMRELPSDKAVTDSQDIRFR